MGAEDPAQQLGVLGFKSQNPHGCFQLPVAPAAGGLVPPFGFMGTRHAHGTQTHGQTSRHKF